MSGAEEKRITGCDISACWGLYALEYFADLLNGDCSLNETISDLRGLIGSKYDSRRAAERVVQNVHIAQQLKPEMPSFADVTKDVQFMTVDEGNKAFVVYSNIARHFRH